VHHNFERLPPIRSERPVWDYHHPNARTIEHSGTNGHGRDNGHGRGNGHGRLADAGVGADPGDEA
jgi:hypothetical protein